MILSSNGKKLNLSHKDNRTLRHLLMHACFADNFTLSMQRMKELTQLDCEAITLLLYDVIDYSLLDCKMNEITRQIESVTVPKATLNHIIYKALKV